MCLLVRIITKKELDEALYKLNDLTEKYTLSEEVETANEWTVFFDYVFYSTTFQGKPLLFRKK